jgi:hypothetical protein
VARLRTHALAALAIVLAACGPMTREEASESAPSCAKEIDAFKEVVIVDDAVTNHDTAKNATGGALGFRHVMARLTAESDDASAATLAWLDQWAPASLRCGWLRARPENACDATCEMCSERHLDLSQAPFRLIAVANRIDLSEPPEQGVGEGRIVFAATEGPGDALRSSPLPVTVAFEFRLTGDRGEWASGWHALGAHRDFDADYLRSLTEITERFVRAEDLAQIRINDAAAASRAVMHEFHLDSKRFVRAGLRRTPSHSSDGSEELRAFVNTNKDHILTGRYELPVSMLTDRIELGETWSLPGVDEPLRHAFAGNTCDGCHGKEHPTTDGGFHISPHAQGEAKLSRFLFDPEHREDDELTRRTRVLAGLICSH